MTVIQRKHNQQALNQLFGLDRWHWVYNTSTTWMRVEYTDANLEAGCQVEA